MLIGSDQPTATQQSSDMSSLAARLSSLKQAAQQTDAAQPQSSADSIVSHADTHVDADTAVVSKEGAARKTEPDQGANSVAADTEQQKLPAEIEALKKKVQDYEKGMRKFQAERDQLKREVEALKKKLTPENEQKLELLNNLLLEFNEAARLGIEGVAIDNILKKLFPQDAIVSWLTNKVQTYATAAGMSKEEKEAFLAKIEEREKIEQEKLALALERQKLDSVKTLEQQRLQAEIKAAVTPAFEKHSFSTGSEKIDELLNNKLWEDGKALLKKYAERGETITPELAHKVFGYVRAQLEPELAAMSIAKQEQQKTAAYKTIAQHQPQPKQKSDDVETLRKKGASLGELLVARFKNMR